MWPTLFAGLLVGAAPEAILRVEIGADAGVPVEVVKEQLELRLREIVTLADDPKADFVLVVGARGFALRNGAGVVVLERSSDGEALPQIRARELALAVEAELRVQLSFNEPPPAPPPTVTAPPPPFVPVTPASAVELGLAFATVWPSGTRTPELGVRGRLALAGPSLRPAFLAGWSRGGGDYRRDELLLAGSLELAWRLGGAELAIAVGAGALAIKAVLERSVVSWHTLLLGGAAVSLELTEGLALRLGATSNLLVKPPEYLLDGDLLESPGRYRLAADLGLVLDL